MTDEEYEDSFCGIHPKQIVPGTLFVSRDPSIRANLLVLGGVDWDYRDAGYGRVEFSVFFSGLHGHTGKSMQCSVNAIEDLYDGRISWINYDDILLPTGNEP